MVQEDQERKNRSARLVGLRESLSRLGGGIGTRGPGEKKLETDRRLIRTRISALKEEFKQVEKHRELFRGKRAIGNLKTSAIVGYTNAGKSTLLNVLTGAEVLSEDKLFATLDPTTRLLELSDGQQTAAIVGYTNAGKSTLLNVLTGAEVLSEDKLFATLDPTTRLLELSDGQQILLTDTVGFIRKLPHHLVEAFKSTLEEAKYADYIIHVVDSSNPQAEKQMHIVYETLRELGAVGKPVITLFNYVERVFPYQEAGKIQLIRERGQLLSEEYTEAGIAVTARVPKEIYAYVGRKNSVDP